jgi:protein HIRA/HIR1
MDVFLASTTFMFITFDVVVVVVVVVVVDNCVKVWSMAMTPEKDGPEFELLATLAWHEQSANCVRWSHNGKYLASGSDDHSVLIYEMQDGAPAAAVPFGSNRPPNKEKWVRCAMLKSHTMGTQDNTSININPFSFIYIL